MPSICARCGEENKEEAKFCNGCGSSLMIDPSDFDPVEPLTSNHVIIERYRIEELIKSGGMGAVYKGHDLRLHKIIAIKELIKLSMSPGERQEDIKRFEREASILANLHHKYLPRVIDYFTVENKYYLVMDFIEGQDLNTILCSDGDPALPEDRVIPWIIQICEVMDYLHNQSPPIIYRDLKPSNIMALTGDKTIKLVDFGIARSIDPDYYTSNTIIGTLGYAPLEQYQGKAEIRSDIYALGATMHHLLTGKKPVPFDFKPLKDINNKVSEKTNNIVMKALSTKPEDRFSSIKEFQDALTGRIDIVIGNAKHMKQLEILIMQLSVQNQELKKLAIKSLGEMNTDQVIQPLINTFKNDEDWKIRKDALLALEKFKDKSITGALCDRLNLEKHSEVKSHIIRVLGEFRVAESVDLIIEMLNDPSSDIKWRSIIALGHIGDKKALEPLFNIVKKDDDFRDDARASIEMIDHEFLKSWRQEEEEKKNKIEETNTIKSIIFTCIILVLGLMVFKFSSDAFNKYKIEKSITEGEKFISSENYEEALNIFQEILKSNPKEGRVYYNLGVIYLNKNQKNEAIEAMSKAVKLDETNLYYKIGMAKAFIASNNIPPAISGLEKVIALNKNISDAYLYLGEACYKKGNKEKAISSFNYCMEKFSGTRSASVAADWIGKLNLKNNEKNSIISALLDEGKNFLYQKKYKEALSSFDEVLSKNPGETEAYFGKAMVYYETGDYDNGEIQFKQVIAIDFNHVKANTALAGIYLKKEHYDKAIEHSTRAINQDPSQPEAYYIRGIAWYNKGKDDEALADFRKYLDIAPTSPESSDVKHWIKEIEKNKK
ncbi:MAG: tetratricopeptide repeat protein [Candidatus Eremiobacterota bacterium]